MDTTGERQEGTNLDEIEAKHVERYRYASKFCIDKSVLDAGCGVGYGSNVLSEKATSVLAVDYSDEAIGYARKHWSADNIEFRVFDLTSPSLDELGEFDAVVNFENVEHLPVPIMDTCRKFYSVLKDGGTLVISHPEKEPVCNNQFHHHFNIDGKKFSEDLIKIGFKIEEDWLQPKRFVADYHVVVAKKIAKDSLEYLYSLPALIVPTSGYGCLTSLRFGVEQITLPDYDWAEFGVGVSTRLLDELKPDNVSLHLFDSLEGLPEDWLEFSTNHTKGRFAKVRQKENWAERENFHAGWFADSLPVFVTERDQPFGFVHIDCDLYSSTVDVLSNIGNFIIPGTVIVFDEYYNYGGDGWKNHEYKAFMEYIASSGHKFEYLGRTNHFQVIVRIVE